MMRSMLLSMLPTAPLRRAQLGVCAVICALFQLPAAAASPAGEPQLNLPRTELRAGMYRIDAQVATQFHERQTGLMHRQSMPQHEGMLFVFEQAGVQCFWMKNTLIPLTAAFVAEDGRIVNLVDMQPLDEQSHCSAEPVRFVLEMNQGWFASKRIAAGTRLTGTPFKHANP